MTISLEWSFKVSLKTYILSFSPLYLVLVNENQIEFHRKGDTRLNSERRLASDNQLEIADELLKLDFIKKVTFDKYGMGIELLGSYSLNNGVKETIEQTIRDIFPGFKVAFN
jgi:hypothetical protein